MQVELSIEELEEIKDALGDKATVSDLEDKVTTIINEQKDLEAMDFDDCAGGACKL